MPTRPVPTQRQRRLGLELRRLRQEAGESTSYAARLLGVDRTKVSNIESGIRAITPDRVQTLAARDGFSDARYIAALADIAADRKRGWWTRHRGTLPQGFLDIAELEWHATLLATAQFVHLPGLLQTEEYARSVMTAIVPPISPLDVELRVDFRMRRAELLRKVESPAYLAYVHEAALRMSFGDRGVMREQLQQLCEMSELPNVTLGILPVDRGAFPGAGQTLLYAHGVVPELDTVQLDSAHGAEFLHTRPELDTYRAHLDWMAEASLGPEASRSFIDAVRRSL